MNPLQQQLFNVIKAIVQIDDFPNYYESHAIRYGFLNYVAKYSLAKDKYLISNKALDHLNNNNFLVEDGLRKGLKNRKNGFTYEHPVPSNVISSEIVKYRDNEEMIAKILDWTDLITVLTTEEDTLLTSCKLGKDMPNGWEFFKSSQFARYDSAGLPNKEKLKEINVFGPLKR